MTEILILSFCMNYFQTDACRSAGEAYYKQSGDEQVIYNYGEKIHKDYKQYDSEFVLIGIVGTFGMNHSYTGRLTTIKGVDVLTTIGTDSNMLTLKKNY